MSEGRRPAPLDFAAVAALVRSSPVRDVLGLLDAEGEEARVVGGAVRNALIGSPVADVDVCTTARPETVIRRAAAAGHRTIPTGIDHGTVTVLVGRAPIEVTTLREDVETTGRHAVVRFGRDFVADALRRDFTINALSAGRDGRVHDHAGGLDDLAARRVRFIGDAATRIREDYLRILRLFRFHAAFGRGRLDPAGLHAAITLRAGLEVLSPERVRVELLKLLAAERALPVLEEVMEAGFLGLLLGGVADLGRAARAIAGRDPVRSLAALGVLVREDAERLRDRLRLSNGEEARLAAYADLVAHLKSLDAPVGAAEARRIAAAFEPQAIGDALAVLRGEPRPRIDGETASLLEDFAAGRAPRPVLPVRGADLVAAGVPKGPEVGLLLAEARRLWVKAGCPEGEEAGAGLLAAALAGRGVGRSVPGG